MRLRRKRHIFSESSEAARSRGRRWWWYVLFLLVCMGMIGSGYFYYFSAEIKDRFASRKWSVPARVFSATTPLYPGQSLSISTMEQMLVKRNYRPSSGKELHAGEFRRGANSVTAFLREFRFPGKEIAAQQVEFRFARDSLATIIGPQGALPFLELEPVDMARLFGSTRESRLLISIQQVPRYLVDAVIAIEDHRFLEHRGVDWWGILRALWTDVRTGRFAQGGSTITQQLVKNYFLTSERTLRRKIVEACMALVLESSYSKDDILEMYLNEIYMGQHGSAAIHGMGEAARYYFGRNVEDLTLPEAAVLAGMIQKPNAFSPYRHAQACQERRNAVLKRMFESGWLPAAEYEEARTALVKVPPQVLALKVAPYFEDYVRQQLQELYSPEVLEREGLTIYTTLHAEVAAAAEQAVEEGLKQLERDHPGLTSDTSDGPLQALMIVLQPKTGAILALVGGRDYDSSSFNRALYALRQPGSAIKPFVYLAGLDQYATTSRLTDEPTTYQLDGRSWSPQNYDHRFRGQVSVRQSLEDSLNVPTVQFAMSIGLPNIIRTLRTLGIQSPLQPVPSLALGAFEVTPLELARAYATLDNDGQQPYLLTIKAVVADTGDVQQQRHIDFTSVTSAAKAYIVTNMLEGVMQRGTAKSAKSMGIDFPCAGKTGTTSDYADSWFVGYTTDLLALVWVGYDDRRPTQLTGASGALRIWTHFCDRVRPWMHPQSFRVPPGILQRLVCCDSGLLATSGCPRKQIEPFLSDRPPERFCDVHGTAPGIQP
jgi:penicillin-binding protein 1B